MKRYHKRIIEMIAEGIFRVIRDTINPVEISNIVPNRAHASRFHSPQAISGKISVQPMVNETVIMVDKPLKNKRCVDMINSSKSISTARILKMVGFSVFFISFVKSPPPAVYIQRVS